MENIICIENAQIKTKINNFIKTCDSLLSMQKELDRTLQAVNAFKVLLRFLKNDSTLIEVYNRFDASGSITAAYTLAKEIADNDYSITIACPDPEPEPTKALNFKYKIGDIIPLGKKVVRQVEQPLTWKVISTSDGKALLFAEKSYLWEPFDTNGNSNWVESSIRNKLNSEWINEVFSEAEREIIIANNVQDLIFVPALDLLIELIPNVQDRCDSKAAWWTSSPTDTAETLVSIQRNGEVQSDGTPATKKQGVRPVFWIVNPVEEVIEEAEPIPEPEVLPVRKVIIVEDGDDFYIAYATPQDRIDSLFLKRFSSESAHFESIEATEAAVDVFKSVNSGKYEIEVSRVSLIDLINKEYEIANQKCIITDNEGYPVVYIDSKGKKTFPLREEDFALRLIDKIKYEAIINELIAKEKAKLDEQFDYYYIGTSTGYEVALDCDAPHTRYEIFKARGVIESFDEYPDLKDTHVDDEKYYNGYIDALTAALNIQRECIFEECNWTIDIVDLRSKGSFTANNDVEGNLPEYGHYKVRVYNEIPELDFSDGSRHVVVAFVHKKIDWIFRDTELALNLPSNVPIVFGNEKQQVNKTHLSRLIKTTICSQCDLGSGDADYRISPEWVPALANFYEFFKDESEDDKGGSNADSTEPADKTRALDLRFMDGSEVLYDYKFKDNRILRSIKMPLNMKRLPEGLFYGCKSLDYVILPDNLRVIGLSAFEGCTSLWKLFLPDTIRRIEDRAFYACSGLKSIFLPEKLEYIGSDAFCGCVKLSKIYIPASIKYIAEDAFDDCFALTKIAAPVGCQLPAFLLSQAKVKYYSDSDDRSSIEEGFEDERINSDYPADPFEDNDDEATDSIADTSLINDATITIASPEETVDDGIVDADTEDEDHTETVTVSTQSDRPTFKAVDLLNNTLILLDNPDDNLSNDLSSVINLLTKEYKNDQV